MSVSNYIKNVSLRYNSGISREHSYRGDLQNFLESTLSRILVTNEPARIDCGAPDFILTRNGVPVGYIEAKDIGEPLTGKKHKEQFERYRESLPNIIFTDYLDFHYYRNGEFVDSVRIGEIAGDKVRLVAANEEKFLGMIQNFADQHLQTIRSSSKLSKMMAAKARLLAEVIEKAVLMDEEYRSSRVDSALRDQLSAFQNVLIHDINEKEFADIYAQTIAYGMFAARLHDKDLETFSRFEAARLIPKSNPFLRNLFRYIADYDLDDRIAWIVDALADLFRATDVAALLRDFGKSTQQTDPIIHFYETFLAEFDPKLRKSRGVWYTPEPVVNFIVRAVDDILKTEFGLKDGLADTSKTKIKVKLPTHDKRRKEGMAEEEREVHKVQILDPAAGTGTFLAEVIRQIHKKFEGQQGIWPDYVENHLIPRLNGFEILMASYAMAHLKLDMLLKETGYDRESDQRFKVYLTNSLEEHHPDTGTLFAGWLSNEANEANHIKRDTPVMVVLGNPPYSGISSNMGKWISDLIEDYKYVDGEHFGERKHWLHDDYVKFIRYGQHFVEKNGEGVLAYINNHSFLDNPTFRGMRWHLLHCFDDIYVIDLHGNSIRKETAPDDKKDENVFDITTGVSINILVKRKKADKIKLASVYEHNLWGKRQNKYTSLSQFDFRKMKFDKVNYSPPYYFFKNKDVSTEQSYNSGFKVSDLLIKNSMGVTTARDNFVIDIDKEVLAKRIKDFCDRSIPQDAFQSKYSLKENYQWKVNEQRNKVPEFDANKIKKIDYRVFDEQYVYYQSNLVFRDRREIMKHLLHKNYALNLAKRGRNIDYHNYYLSKYITDKSITSSLDNTNTFPLYLYPDNSQESLDGTPARKPNLNPKIVKKIAAGLGLKFTPEKEETEGTFAPIDLLDYIYAILYSPAYRETYKEFLKIDFPRVPYPKDPEQFWKLVGLGGELRKLHLMEHPVLEEFITTYPKAGSNEVTRKLTATSPGYEPDGPGSETGNVWINDEQYFGNVPKTAWEFYIGGYQPAQKWLKDRRGRVLTIEEVRHYQKIVVALVETGRLMGEVDGVINNSLNSI